MDDATVEAIRDRVLRELSGRYGTEDWPWLSDLVEVVVALIQQEIAALPDPRPTEAEAEVLRLVDEQAEDEGLWFAATTMPEAYLQQELRQLHALIEGCFRPEEDPRG